MHAKEVKSTEERTQPKDFNTRVQVKWNNHNQKTKMGRRTTQWTF